MDNKVDKNTWAYWYDIINTKSRNDYQFYSNLMDENSLALELACGTGRIYLDMINDGYNVHGLDISEDMLLKLKNKAKNKDITVDKLINEDISSMNLENRYDVIYYPFNSICHINNGVDNKIDVFSNIRDHLEDDGIFAFDLFVADFDVMETYGDLKSKHFEHESTIYKFETWTEVVSKVEQTIRSKNRVINVDEDKLVWNEYHNLSLYPKQQIELILKCSGFSEYDIYHEFTDQSLKQDSEIMSIVARN